MLRFIDLGTILATALSTQITSSALIPKTTANQQVQASTSHLVVNATADARTASANNGTPLMLADSSTRGVTEKVDPAQIGFGLAVVGGVAIGIVLSVKKDKNPLKLSSLPRYNSSPESTICINQASRRPQQKLLLLLHGDSDAANRLLAQAKRRNPNRSVDWYVEKVTYDLERDRGSY